MNTQKLASCIAEYRKKSGMTQREFADHLGVTAKAVSKWETGIFQQFVVIPCLS